MTVFQHGVYILVESLRPSIFHVTTPMSFRKAPLLALASILLGALIGCSSSPQATKTAASKPASATEADQIRNAMSMSSAHAHSLYVEGDIAFEDDGERKSTCLNS